MLAEDSLEECGIITRILEHCHELEVLSLQHTGAYWAGGITPFDTVSLYCSTLRDSARRAVLQSLISAILYGLIKLSAGMKPF